MDTKELGNLGEKIACEYLVGKGFKILGRNYRISFGEIDIIANKKPALLHKIFQILNPRWAGLFSGARHIFQKNGSTIHFVEVKTIVQNDGFFPEDRVDYTKQRKLVNLARIWLQKNKYRQHQPYQIDIIGISVDENAKLVKLHYFPNAVEDDSFIDSG